MTRQIKTGFNIPKSFTHRYILLHEPDGPDPVRMEIRRSSARSLLLTGHGFQVAMMGVVPECLKIIQDVDAWQWNTVQEIKARLKPGRPRRHVKK